MMTVRIATKEDASLIADISRETFQETFASSNTKEDMDKFMNEQFTRKMLMKESETPGNTFLLAYLDGELAGYARLRENNIPPGLPNNNAIEISRIYARSSFIGKGVGALLMDHCLEAARQRGKEIAWLGVWQKNERAIRFYQNWGFITFAEHDFILGNDVQKDWLMMKKL